MSVGMAVSLPVTRTTSPQSDIQLVNRNLRTATATTTPMTPTNRTMILPITKPTSVDIKKVYSNNDINYNNAIVNERFTLSADLNTHHHYCEHNHNQDFQKQPTTPQAEAEEEEDHQHSYHTL